MCMRRQTNSDGRCLTLLPPRDSLEAAAKPLQTGLYKIVFKTKEYFEGSGRKCFYPWVEARSVDPLAIILR